MNPFDTLFKYVITSVWESLEKKNPTLSIYCFINSKISLCRQEKQSTVQNPTFHMNLLVFQLSTSAEYVKTPIISPEYYFQLLLLNYITMLRHT